MAALPQSQIHNLTQTIPSDAPHCWDGAATSFGMAPCPESEWSKLDRDDYSLLSALFHATLLPSVANWWSLFSTAHQKHLWFVQMYHMFLWKRLYNSCYSCVLTLAGLVTGLLMKVCRFPAFNLLCALFGWALETDSCFPPSAPCSTS